MKPAFVKSFIAIAALAGLALALPTELVGQQTRYKLIDLGTFGGPNAVVNGPGTRDLSNSGTYAGYAETAIPDPYAPNCVNPECLVYHTQVWRNGVVSDLGSLPGVNNSSASWISANGRFIVGSSENGLTDPLLGVPEMQAVFWQNGQIRNLGTLGGGFESFATTANSLGQLTGISTNLIPDPFSMFCFIVCATTQSRAFLWQNGVMQDLGTLGGPDAGPDVINDQGQIAGHSYTNSIPNADNGPHCPPNVPTQDPFFWDEKGGMIDVGTLGGTCGVTLWINNSGQVVGISDLAGNQTFHPFFWDRGVLSDIGTFGGSNGEALRISDSGLVVGRADLADGTHHAFVWKNGVMVDVGVVPGDLCTNGRAINSAGQAVGTSTDCMGNVLHMFLWQNGSIQDLTALILPGSDIQVFEALDINDLGEIAAVGGLPNGDVHAVLLIPASAEEIAAAANLPAANATTNSSRRPVTTSADSPAAGRNSLLNRFRRMHPQP